MSAFARGKASFRRRLDEALKAAQLALDAAELATVRVRQAFQALIALHFEERQKRTRE